MKILIAEDDFASRKFLYKLLSQYGACDMTVDGIETVEAFAIAQDMGEPYDLLCLDIMMPKIDGLKALKTIREFERKKGIKESEKCKVIITSALSETEVAFESFSTGSEVYQTKPIDVEMFRDAMKKLQLI
jgi:two-component system, chemotaxis family, chemotaxis protein CheY